MEKYPVVIFMKGTPDEPRCGFSFRSVDVLKSVGVPFVGVDVLADEAVRQGVKDLTEWPTIPQIFVRGQFIGGCDILEEMHGDGSLQKLVQDIPPN